MMYFGSIALYSILFWVTILNFPTESWAWYLVPVLTVWSNFHAIAFLIFSGILIALTEFGFAIVSLPVAYVMTIVAIYFFAIMYVYPHL